MTAEMWVGWMEGSCERLCEWELGGYTPSALGFNDEVGRPEKDEENKYSIK